MEHYRKEQSEEFPKSLSLEAFTKERICIKVKTVRQNFKKAVDKGKSNGGGQDVMTFYHLAVTSGLGPLPRRALMVYIFVFFLYPWNVCEVEILFKVQKNINLKKNFTRKNFLCQNAAKYNILTTLDNQNTTTNYSMFCRIMLAPVLLFTTMPCLEMVYLLYESCVINSAQISLGGGVIS